MYSRPSNRSVRVWTVGGLALSVIVTPCSVLAQDPDPPGQVTQEGALFLLLPVGAQAIGVARATTALPSAEGAFWNPAGLASVDRSQVLVYHGNHLTGNGTGFSALFARPGTGTLAVSYNLLDESGIDVTDDIGMVVGSIAVRGHQGILSVAFPALSWLSAGLNAKFVSSGVTCRGQCPEGTSGSNTYAFDAGVQFQPVPDRPLFVGVMVAHVGPEFNEGNTGQPEPLPSRIRAGVSYHLTRDFLEEEFGLRILLELEDRLRALGTRSLHLASELTAGTGDQVFIRGGVIFANRNQTDGAAVGFGLRYERFEFGIARSLARGGPVLQQEPVHLTVGLSF